MTTRWTPAALRDLASLHAYIALDNPNAAAETAANVAAGIEQLARHPGMGRKGRARGTRELVIPPYVTAYRVTGESVEIVAIIHGARRWPDSF